MREDRAQQIARGRAHLAAMTPEERERVHAAAAGLVRSALWCRACRDGDHSGHVPDHGDACRRDNAFNSDCRCPDEPRADREN